MCSADSPRQPAVSVVQHTLSPPLPGLDALIEGVWDVQVSDASYARRLHATTPPECGMGIIFCYGASLVVKVDGRAQRLRSHVSGLHLTAHQLTAEGAAGVLSVRLTELGARLYLGGPMRAFAHTRTALADVLSPSRAASIEDELDACATAAQRSEVAQQHVARWMGEPVAPDALSLAFEHLRRDVHLRVGDLPATLGLSERALQRRFLDRYGVRPKQMLLSARAREAVRLARNGTAWAEIAQLCGFADQAHLIRSFKAAFGQTPQAWRRMQAAGLPDSAGAGQDLAAQFNTAIAPLGADSD